MSLFSFSFFVFLCVGVLVYYLLPGRWQWVCLLVLSGGFYACAGPAGLLFPAVTIVTTWLGGLAMAGWTGCAPPRVHPAEKRPGGPPPKPKAPLFLGGAGAELRRAGLAEIRGAAVGPHRAVAAAGHLLLHLQRHGVPDRRVPRHRAGPAQPAPPGAVRGLFPAASAGPHRPLGPDRPPAAGAPFLPADGAAARHPAHAVGLL